MTWVSERLLPECCSAGKVLEIQRVPECFLEIQVLGHEIQWLDLLSVSLSPMLNGTDKGCYSLYALNQLLFWKYYQPFGPQPRKG